MAQGEYQRLPGAHRGLFANHTLWLAHDHILSVHSLRIREVYKRYYLGDIQAILIRPHGAWRLHGLGIDLAAGGVTVAILLLGRTHPFVTALLLSVLVPLAVARAGGPACRCHIVTAVSNDPLPALRRLRAARRTAAILRPLIEAAQSRQPLPPWRESADPRDAGASALFCCLQTLLAAAAWIAAWRREPPELILQLVLFAAAVSLASAVYAWRCDLPWLFRAVSLFNGLPAAGIAMRIHEPAPVLLAVLTSLAAAGSLAAVFRWYVLAGVRPQS